VIKNILRAEGFVLFLLSSFFYIKLQGNWWMFIIIFLSIDFSMIGYLKNNKMGSQLYNVIHNYILAMLLFFIGFFYSSQVFQQVGIIVAAHVSIDRFFGFGLKNSSGFKDTHLGKI
jgi:hypothetical protein